MTPPGSSVKATTTTATPAGVARRAALAALVFLLRGSAAVAEVHPRQQRQGPDASASTAGLAEAQARKASTPTLPPLSRDASILELEHHPQENVGDGGGGSARGGGGDGGSRILTRPPPRSDRERNGDFAHTLARGLTSTSDGGGGDCSDEFTACGGDPVCLSCVNEHVNMNECVETYHVSGSDGTADDVVEMTFCQNLATSYCCGAYDVYVAGAVSCVDDDLVIEYWTCSLESNGCSVEDLPCYGVDLSVMLESEREAELEAEATDSDTTWEQASTANSGGDMASVTNDADTNGVATHTTLGIFGTSAGGGIAIVSLLSYIGALWLFMVDGWQAW